MTSLEGRGIEICDVICGSHIRREFGANPELPPAHLRRRKCTVRVPVRPELFYMGAGRKGKTVLGWEGGEFPNRFRDTGILTVHLS